MAVPGCGSVFPVPGEEEAILALPEDFALASGQRLEAWSGSPG